MNPVCKTQAMTVKSRWGNRMSINQRTSHIYCTSLARSSREASGLQSDHLSFPQFMKTLASTNKVMRKRSTADTAIVAVDSDSGFSKFGGDPSGFSPAGMVHGSTPGGNAAAMTFS